jgi:hypothetical protein
MLRKMTIFVGLCVVLMNAACNSTPKSAAVAFETVGQHFTAAELEQAASNPFSTSEARRLVLACDELRDLDPQRYQSVCADNPALTHALSLLTAKAADLTPQERERINRFARPDSAQSGQAERRAKILTRVAGHAAYTEAVEREVRAVSASFGQALSGGSVAGLMRAESKLNVLAQNLKQSMGKKADVIPENHFLLLERPALQVLLDHANQQRHKAAKALALAPTGSRAVLLENLDQRIAHLQDAQRRNPEFHRHFPRDDLGDFDEPRFQRAQASATADEQQEFQRLVTASASAFPDSERGLFAASVLASAGLNGLPVRDLTASEIIEAQFCYYSDPVRWVRLISRLRVKFEQQRGTGGQTFEEWMAGRLNADERLAVNTMARSMVKAGTLNAGGPELPFHPEEQALLWFSRIAAATDRGHQGEENGPVKRPEPAGTGPSGGEPEPAVLALNLVRGAEGRWGGPHGMPKDVLEQVNLALGEAFGGYLARLETIISNLRSTEEAAAISDEGFSAADARAFWDSSSQAAAVAEALTRVARQDMAAGYTFPEDKEKKLKTLVSFFRTRPPPASEAGMAVLRPVRPQGPGGSGAAAIVADAVLERRFTDLETVLPRMVRVAKSLREEPRLTNTDIGRWTVDESKLNFARFESSKSKWEPQETRLPKSLADWTGLWKNKVTQTPYDYMAEVREGTSVKVYGGGIHMGAPASLDGNVNGGIAVRFDGRRNMLILQLADGRIFSMPSVSPAEFKALYRFAGTNQNLAVSVGWTGDESNYKAASDTSPVLLNPYFVDTIVGQRLFLADQLPWRLDKAALPNGRPNPIAVEFAGAHTAAIDSLRRNIRSIVAQVPPGYEPVSNDFIQTLLARATTLGILLDDPMTLRLREHTIAPEGSVHYRYVTNELSIETGANGKPEILATMRDIPKLGQIATENLPQLSAAYPPLGNAIQYARTVAFIRWARSDDRVTRFDLSDLVGIRASDRQSTPTPDSVKRL